MKMFWKILKKKSHITFGKSSRERYDELIEAYTLYPTPDNAAALENLFGTSTPFEDISYAMKTEFDPNYYLFINPDVREAQVDPAYHYLMWGWKEHRIPSKFFDPHFYYRRHKELDSQEFALAHYARTDRVAGIPANEIGDHYWFTPFCPSEEHWNNVKPAVRSSTTRAVVVIPVYKGLEETLTSIYHALNSRNGEEYSVLVINDNSPDVKLVKKISHLAQKGLFELYNNDINRGFVKTINFAIEYLTGDLDVVLLNSDAYVNPGWFNRLIAHADRDQNVATITPLSNNATICSYPLYDKDNYHSLEVNPQEIDKLASVANNGIAVETPTGVGFCFYMRRAAIQALGKLDEEVFLLGYGEENDFCMRALNAGWKNLIAGDVFVFHTGSVSFSSKKEENFAHGQVSLQRKHPNYEELVKSHVKADPERVMRRNIDAQRVLRVFSGAVIIITHKWAGGIETYLKHYITELGRKGKKALIFRVHDFHHISVEDPAYQPIFLPNLAGLDLRSEWDFVTRLLRDLRPNLIHINSFAGLTWEWHRRIIEELSVNDTDKVFIGHDYSPISHHYQLLRPDNVFDGIPTLAKLRDWQAMKDSTGSVDVCSPEERLKTYSAFFKSGVRVEVPSDTSRHIYKKFFTDINVFTLPHKDHLPDMEPAKRQTGREKLCIAVVGAIGTHKGSEVLVSLARDAHIRRLKIEYHLIGYSNHDECLRNFGVNISGRYNSEIEAIDILKEIKPDMLLIPSIWPETFCYTLSIGIKLRIPLVVFDIGAQAERAARIKWGKLLPIEFCKSPCILSNTLLSIDLDELWLLANKKY